MIRRRGRPTGMGQLVRRWVHRNHFDEKVLICQLQLRWPELLGARLAGRTRAQAFSEGQLTIAVANSAWLNELTFLRDDLRKQLNRQLAGTPIHKLRFVVGGTAGEAKAPRVQVRDRRRVPRPTAARLAAALEQARAELPAGGEDELVVAIRRARAAQLARDQEPGGLREQARREADALERSAESPEPNKN